MILKENRKTFLGESAEHYYVNKHANSSKKKKTPQTTAGCNEEVKAKSVYFVTECKQKEYTVTSL